MLTTSVSKNVNGCHGVWNFSKLQNFVVFVFKFYKTQMNNIEKWHKSYTDPGGFCDMTLLYYFTNNENTFQGLRLAHYPYFKDDLTQVFNDEFTFDATIASLGNHLYPDDYDSENNIKKIKFIDRKPYCYNKRLKKDIRFVLLHFQGNAKRFINKFLVINK
jgi:hypothetical protein